MTRALWTHLVKDLRIEWRSLDAINSMLFFALLVVVLFSIAFDPRGAFSQRDRRRRALRGHHVRLRQRAQPGLGARDPPPGSGCAAHGAHLRRRTCSSPRCSPISSSSPSCRSCWRRSSWSCTTCTSQGKAWLLALVLPLGTWALVANGTFFAALSIRSRNRELLLPLILFPIFMPALLAMVQATGIDPHRRQRSLRSGSRC